MKYVIEFLSSHARFWGALGIGAFSGIDLIMRHTDEINTLFGAIITIITVVSALVHDYEIEKTKLQTQTKTAPATATSSVTQ